MNMEHVLRLARVREWLTDSMETDVQAGGQLTEVTAMQKALSGGSPGGCEPLDWLHTTAPRSWRFGEEKVTYRWEEPAGAYPMRV